MLWNIIPKNINFSKTLPEFKRRLKKHLTPCNVLHVNFSIIGYTPIHNNCVVSIYIVMGAINLDLLVLLGFD